jgi:hypothetical protein
MEPNWDRDFEEAGTISFVLKVPNTNDSRVFFFHYGLDDPHAPAGCEDYKKWLADGKRLNVTLDRQRGGACYIEGTDDKGIAVFRFHVTYGGKPLICGGPLYKDAASAPLGDLRDKVVAAAKQICGTLAL